MDAREANRAFNEDRYEESFALYSQMATHTKDADAIYMLALHYKDGLGVAQNDDEALKLFKRAKQLGSLDAKYELLEMSQTISQCCKE